MIDIIVRRGDGLHEGDEIIDPLIGSLPCALSRGKAELDARAAGHGDASYQIPYRTGLRSGQMIQVHDEEAGKVIHGKLVGIQHSAGLAKRLTEITIEQPAEFAL